MKEWRPSKMENAEYIGVLEFQDHSLEWHNFEVYISILEDRLVFGSHCNVGFLESGYLKLNGMSLDAGLQELLADLECLYNDGREYTTYIVCNERI